MPATTVRISRSSHRTLQKLSKQTGQSMTEVLDQALESYRRKLFFQQLNAGYAALQADQGAWGQMVAERKLWDATLMDGLDPEEQWDEKTRTPIHKRKGK